MREVRVLVVDDQPPFRQAAEAVIEALDGFTLAGRAESGEEAVEAAAALHPALVLLDVSLPAMSGPEVCRILSEQDPAPVVVLVSTYDSSEFGDEVRTCGAAGYLRKSEFGPDRLLQVWQRSSSVE